MKKFLRFLLVILGVIVLGIIILGIIEPMDVTVTRNTVISAPEDIVWDEIQYFKNWPTWSPWLAMEPTAQLTYSGVDGKEGSSYHWVGKTIGEGIMKNTGVKTGELDWALSILKPISSESVGYLKMKDTTGGNIKVTWTLYQHHTFPTNAMCAFFSLDKLLGPDFEAGLANMKKYCENKASSMPKVDVQETQFAARTYVGVRKVVGWMDIMKLCGDTYPALRKDAAKVIAEPATGLYWTWDTTAHTTDMAAVFSVSDTSKPVKGATFIYVPASKANMAVLKGGYSGEMAVHGALMKYEMKKGQKHTLVVEEYVSGPLTEKDSTKWITNIYYLHP